MEDKGKRGSVARHQLFIKGIEIPLWMMIENIMEVRQDAGNVFLDDAVNVLRAIEAAKTDEDCIDLVRTLQRICGGRASREPCCGESARRATSEPDDEKIAELVVRCVADSLKRFPERFPVSLETGLDGRDIGLLDRIELLMDIEDALWRSGLLESKARLPDSLCYEMETVKCLADAVKRVVKGGGNPDGKAMGKEADNGEA